VEVHSAGVHDVILYDVDVWSSGVHMLCGRVLGVRTWHGRACCGCPLKLTSSTVKTLNFSSDFLLLYVALRRLYANL
jgi:hypothetical protein